MELCFGADVVSTRYPSCRTPFTSLYNHLLALIACNCPQVPLGLEHLVRKKWDWLHGITLLCPIRRATNSRIPLNQAQNILSVDSQPLTLINKGSLCPYLRVCAHRSFEKLADPSKGVMGIQFRAVPCSYKPAKPASPVPSPSPAGAQQTPAGWNASMDRRPWP